MTIKISDAQEKLEALKTKDAEKMATSNSILPIYGQFKSWAEEFESAPLEMKK